MKNKKTRKAAKAAVESALQTQLQVAFHFPCPLYMIERPDFLASVSAASEESLAARRKMQELDEIFPVVMGGNLLSDPRVKPFVEFVGAAAWNILNEQGYAMHDKAVQFTEMWPQEHHKHSAMDQHVHGAGSQIVGFYFLETPENCSRAVFHDPRSGKVQIDLPEQNESLATPASKTINFVPRPGLMLFANSWLAHSFTRHASDLPIKFIHFNLTVINVASLGQPQTAEVI